MDKPRRVVIVRHAESYRNKAKGKGNTYFPNDEARQIVKGIPSYKIEITTLGVQQAIKTGITLRRRFGCFDYIYHSGYKRTIQTMQHILEAYTIDERKKMQIRQNIYLRERITGFTYEMTKDEVERIFPWLQPYWDTVGNFEARPPGGESLEDVAKNVRYFYDNELRRKRSGQSVLCVAHGGSIRGMRFNIENWDYERAATWPGSDEESPKNCGVTIYEYDKQERRLILREYNTTYWSQ